VPGFWTVIALVPLAIWGYLLLARAGFWRVGQLLPPADSPPPGRHTVAVVPARDEADVIALAVESLLRQDYPGTLDVIVVDDGSSDGTAQAARAGAQRAGAAARLTVLAGAPPGPGWTGKLWAVQQGVVAAQARSPDYLLLSDADIRHAPGNLASLIGIAECRMRDLVSYMVRLASATWPERCLIPAFVWFFFLLYPPRWVAQPQARTAAAAGGCMLVRPAALARAGGLAAIRAELIDDCALARAIKRSGGRIWLGLTGSAESLRGYRSFAEIGRMISRSAFNQLHHSYGLLALTLLGLAITYVLPIALLLCAHPLPIAAGALCWALMSAAYLPMVRFYRLTPLWSIALPGIALFYAAATLHSAVQYGRGRGGRWKGRVQDARA